MAVGVARDGFDGDGTGDPRYEIRPAYPVRRREKLRRKKGTAVRLLIGHHGSRPHLPVIHLRPAA